MPEYLAELPLDPHSSWPNPPQYLYRSNGVEYKLIAYQVRDCESVRRINPEMIDPARDRSGKQCYSYGFYTVGAKDW